MVVTTIGSQIKRTETISQLKEDISEFYECFKKKYLALRHKHIKEHKELRRLNDDKYGTGKRQFVFFYYYYYYYYYYCNVVRLFIETKDSVFLSRKS